jgi:hypothetical protein
MAGYPREVIFLWVAPLHICSHDKHGIFLMVSLATAKFPHQKDFLTADMWGLFSLKFP